MNRRHFLTTSGTAALSLTFPKLAPSADAPPWPAFTFLVITDTHIGYNDGEGATRQWAKTAAELAGAEGSFVLHLGDVVDRGQSDLYPVYIKERAEIKKPVYEIAGNHDELEDFEARLTVKGDRAISFGGVTFILFSNARRTSHDGFVSRDQLDWISEKCDRAADTGKHIIFCSHVPFHDNRAPDRAWHVKPGNGQPEFYEIVEKHKSRVLGSFHGHFHNGIRGWTDNAPLHEIIFPSALYNQDRGITRGRAPGYNLDEFRPGYTKVTLSDHKMTLEYVPVGEDGDPAEKELTYST